MECIQCLMGLHHRGGMAWVAGNHDRVVRGDIEPVGFSEEALKTLEWTRRQVTAEKWALQFLQSAPLTAEVNSMIWLTHESLADPGSGRYNREPQQARPELAALTEKGGRICFYGHTHRFRAEVSEGSEKVFLIPFEPHEAEGRDPNPLQLKPGSAGWIATGSAGFPVNSKRAAECLILDDRHWQIEKYAVSYPRERTRARVRKVLGEECGRDLAERIARWL
jgi:predicted phosphodiesterase